jgi:hypothetical protein
LQAWRLGTGFISRIAPATDSPAIGQNRVLAGLLIQYKTTKQR